MKLKIYSLVGCPYSLRAERLAKNMKIKNEIIKVRGEKEKLSIKKTKSKNISTNLCGER